MTTDLLFDARHVRASGIGVYAREQVKQLGPWAKQNGLTVAVLGNPEHLDALGREVEILRPTRHSTPMYSLKEQIEFASALRKIRPSAFWTPHYPYPTLAASHNTFVTIHDVLHALRRSEGGPGIARSIYARSMIRVALHRSRGVFVPSLATKNEVIRVFGDSDQMQVAPMRIDEAWLRDVNHGLRPKNLPDSYILFVGNVKKHKNLTGLLEAFETIQDQINVDLVLAGGAADVRNQDSVVFDRVKSLGKRVHMTGNLSFESLRSTVAGASCLVMPSHYEGVGLPPLEAMAVGTPVVASEIPSLRETCGDAAIYFKSADVRSMAESIVQLLESPALQEALIRRGRERLRQRESSIDPLLPLKVIAERCF